MMREMASTTFQDLADEAAGIPLEISALI